MLAVDTSTLIRHFDGRATAETRKLEEAIKQGRAVIPPVVATEFLSWPELTRSQAEVLELLEVLPIVDEYWTRAGLLRAAVLRAGRRAKLGDALIAQACIDAGVPLLTSDSDFSAFRDVGGLQLA